MKDSFELELKVENVQGEKNELFTGIDMELAYFGLVRIRLTVIFIE